MIAEHGALEMRLAARLADSLIASPLSHDVGERLRVAREQAVARARQLRLAAAPQSSGTALLGVARARALALTGAARTDDSAPWQDWLASALPLLLLVAGLLFINQWTVREDLLVAAEIDTLLLADDLPPAAYADPGFAEYLRSGPLR